MADAGDVKLTLATSFQCALYKLDEKTDHFSDNRETIGFNYEAQAVGLAIQEQRLQHPIMPHSTSHLLQQQMEMIKELF